MSPLSQPRPRELTQQDVNRLAGLLASQAVNFPAGKYYDNLLLTASLTPPFRAEVLGTLDGPALFSARRLINWAAGKKGGNPRDPSWTTLGSLLFALLEEGTLGLEQVALVAGIIESGRLYLTNESGQKFRATYGVPDRQVATVVAADIGPDIDWQGPTDVVQLQSWLGPEPTDYTLEFLQSAVRRARAVCKVEFSKLRSGTGVLIARDLILTNHHVVFGEGEKGSESLPEGCVVSFTGLAGTGGPASVSAPLVAGPGSLVAKSSVDGLDYALLRLPESLASAQGLDVAPVSPEKPTKKDSLNLLHHPRGEAIRVTLSDGGVTSILDEKGYLQYVTRSAPGSSGAPCFDDEWRLVGIHHAERTRPFGRVGEGILIYRIFEEIVPHLG